ncbi:MAG: DUF2764 family protein [Bacteroidales bacterium]|nr:DUF2764 family protein [Bacteroidales bacterium]
MISGLYDIKIEGVKPKELSLKFKDELAEQLHTSDYNLAKLLYLQYDNKNLLNLLLKQNKPFIPMGNYTLEYLDEQIKDPTDIVYYMANIINNFNEGKVENSNLFCENNLQSLYYEYVFQVKNSFLKQWFRFNRDIKNILSAVNCRKYNYNIENQLISVKNENNIYNILIKRGPKVELLADEVPFVDELLQIATSEMDITDKEKAIDLIKWKFLDEQTIFNYFTIEKVLSYIIKLEILERWIKLDNETGEVILNKLINDMKTSYKFSDEFILLQNREFANN